jgi:alpha-tubulin suppressor-like RCC1 family protein
MLLWLCCVALAGGVGSCSIDRPTATECKRCARHVAIAYSHTCVHLYDNSVECVGSNYYAQLGLGRRDRPPDTENLYVRLVPAPVLAGVSVKSVDCGYGFTCVLATAVEGSDVYCFGDNKLNRLGAGTTAQESATPVLVQGLKQTPGIAQLAVGSSFACVAYAGSDEFDTVQCWGGDSATAQRSALPLDVPGTAGATALAAGYNHACAILRDKTVVCWDAGSVAATQPPGLNDVVRIAAGDRYACGIVQPAGSLRTLWCWGRDNSPGTFWKSRFVSNSEAPWQVPGLPGNVLDVVAGAAHACALVEVGSSGSGDVYCWGLNEYGELGQGYRNDTGSPEPPAIVTPLRVKGLSNVTRVFGSGSKSTCALTVSQRVVCWGNNYAGHLGIGTPEHNIRLPVVMDRLCA